MQHRQIPVTFALDGKPVDSVTDLLRAGPYVLTMHTVMPQPGLAVELHSTFVGHRAVCTQTTHLLLGPVGKPAYVVTREDTSGIVDPVNRPASCVYAHCHELIALLAARGVDIAVDQLPPRPVPLPR